MAIDAQNGDANYAQSFPETHVRAARKRWLATVIIAVGVGAIGFAIGRATAPAHEKVVGASCVASEPAAGASGRIEIALRDGSSGWYASCDRGAAFIASVREHRLARQINIYASEHGDHVVAWLYVDCDSEQGIVAPGTTHPRCLSAGTTQPG